MKCMFEKNRRQELERLEKRLMELKKPMLTSQKKALMRTHLLNQINRPQEERMTSMLELLMNYVKRVAAGLEFGAARKVMIKERILNLIEDQTQGRFFWSNIWVLNKKMVSLIVLVSMFFGLWSFTIIDSQVVRAETFTVLEQFSGDVKVERDGEEVILYPGMEILENDEIVTGDGLAVVRYFDDSVSRLAQETRLKVEKLFKKKGSYASSYVEVSLAAGKLWSKVINLVGDESAFVVKARDVSMAAKKAAFNVELSDQQVEIQVFNNTVDVQRADQHGKVVTGQKAVVNGDIRVESIPDAEKSVAWVQDNLDNDKAYLSEVEQRLIVAKLESIDGESVEGVTIDQSLIEKTALFLTFDEVKKQRRELDAAEKQLIAAQLSLKSIGDLSDEEKSVIEKNVTDFYQRVQNFYQIIDQVAVTDEKYAGELTGYLDEKLLALKKDMSMVLPGAPDYGVKEKVDELIVMGAKNNVDVTARKLDVSLEKLGELEEIDEQNQQELVKNLVDQNTVTILETVAMLDSLKPEQVEEKEKLVNKAKEYFALLDSLYGQLSDEMAQAKVKVDGLAAEIAAAKNSPSEEVVGQSKDESPEPVSVAPPSSNSTVEVGDYGVKIQNGKPLPAGL